MQLFPTIFVGLVAVALGKEDKCEYTARADCDQHTTCTVSHADSQTCAPLGSWLRYRAACGVGPHTVTRKGNERQGAVNEVGRGGGFHLCTT
jgi:hypothetical protein